MADESLISTDIGSIPPAYVLLAEELTASIVYLLLPTALIYLAIYVNVRGHASLFKLFTFASVLGFWASSWVAPISCGPARCVQNFAVIIGIMKMLDIFARRNDLPMYNAGKRPPPSLFALIILTELRYESFSPNHIRLARLDENFSEPLQLAIHAGVFALLQAAPQHVPTILAFEVLLAIYLIFTTLQLLLRYRTSPALFGPLYRADSLTGFWSETWHNTFASPCQSLAYNPLRYGLPKIGVPVSIARGFGVMGAFVLMGWFHVYSLTPLLPRHSLVRIGLFFFLNGVATVAETAIWGRKRHWVKTLLAWSFEVTLATWTAEASHIPNGLSRIPWKDMCGPAV